MATLFYLKDMFFRDPAKKTALQHRCRIMNGSIKL